MSVRRRCLVVLAVLATVGRGAADDLAFDAGAEPIDLPTTLRLVSQSSPAVAVARARLAEAVAREDRARLQWLPSLTAGVTYNRFDGLTQNQRGEVFSVSRANIFFSGGPGLRLDTADAVYDRLIARRLTAAEQAGTQQTAIDAQLDAALAFVELTQAYAFLAENAVTRAEAEKLLARALRARAADLTRPPGTAVRAEAEVSARRQERFELEGRAGVAMAQLARACMLPPATPLRPANPTPTPLPLVDLATPVDELVAVTIANRPDLAAHRSLVAAAWERVRKAKAAPLLPRAVVEQQTGGYGAGKNDILGPFGGRSALTAGFVWELRNLGFGTAAFTREERARWEQTVHRLADVQQRAAAEVVSAARSATARGKSLTVARQTADDAAEWYRRTVVAGTKVLDAGQTYDAQEELRALQAWHQARGLAAAAVSEYNRAQFRLYTALGSPPDSAPAAAPPP